MRIEERSYEIITFEDLKELQRIALRQREKFFERNPHLREAYWDSLIAIALCQGAAKHYIDHTTGIKDFDIWWFYVKNPRKDYPYRARKRVDSKLSKFGIHPADVKAGYEGRKIDFMGRAIDKDIVERQKGNSVGCIVEYLKERRTETSRKLAEKPVIGLHPNELLGKTIWLL